MNKVALVTGGARRIGAAITSALHGKGHDVVIHYNRSRREAESLADRLNDLRGGSAMTLQADLLSPEQVTTLAGQSIRCFGRLDALINNASSFYPTPLGHIDEQSWDDLIGTNLKAPIFLTQALAHELATRQGSVVNIADIHAEKPLRDHLVYNVGKAGLVAATRSLALELGPRIRVNAVAPGANIWPEDAGFLDTGKRQRILEHCILGRAGTPEDIAEAVVFLVTGASYITGHILTVDGGRGIVLAD